MEYVKFIRSYIKKIPVIFAGANVIVLNEKKEILLQLRTDTNDWGTIGGVMELGETYEETAKRELFEETGLTADSFKCIGSFSGKKSYYKYPNEDEIYAADLIFKAINVKGELTLDKEGKELRYFKKEELSEIKLNPVSKEILKKCGYL